MAFHFRRFVGMFVRSAKPMNRKDRPLPKRPGTDVVLVWTLAIAVAVRLALPRMFGLLDNDSIVLFLDARRQIQTDAWAMASTLQVWLISFFYRLLEEKLHAARWVSVLAGLGVMLVLFQAAGRTRAGRIAAVVFAVTPVAVFFGVSALPYGLLTFFGILGLWLLAETQGERGPEYGLAAGLAFGAAFLCKTFAAVMILPAGIALLETVLRPADRRRRTWLGPLLALAGWSAVVGLAVAWRRPVYGWSVFNDYPTDWRFDLAAAVWSGRWVGLVNLQAMALPWLLPGVVLAWRERRANPFARYALWYAAAITAVFLLNPVNHFPRVLYPVAPVLAYFTALALAEALKRQRAALPALLLAVGVVLLAGQGLWPGAWLDGRLWPVALAAALTVFAALAVPKLNWTASPVATDRLAAAALAVFAVFGLWAGYGDLDRVEREYMAQVQSVRFANTAGGIIGGGDAMHLVLNGKANYSTLLDLPEEKLRQALADGLPSVMRDLQTPWAIVDPEGRDGTGAMFAPLAAEMGLADDPPPDPSAALETDAHAARLYDNGRYVAYHLEDVFAPEGDAWPQWARIDVPWNRTRIGLPHPTTATLAVRQRPASYEVDGTGVRAVKVEFSDAPDGENFYRLSVIARDAAGEVVWRWEKELVTDYNADAPGVWLTPLTIDREKHEGRLSVVIPPKAGHVARLEVTAQPVGSGRALRVLVPLPGWW
jgi:Dolichyl-phosphate-mannose-protein mannosyltransferase